MSLLSINKKEKLVLKVNFPDEAQDRVFMYKLSSMCTQVNQDGGEDYYIAVPNGKSVAVKNLPSGEYNLTLI